MGSFAFSSHVKSASAAEVAWTIRSILCAQGWSSSETMVPHQVVDKSANARRGFRVAQGQGGWVSFLDSSMEHAEDLAAQVSDRLATESLLVLVNDSDSWHYVYHRQGHLVDSFDSLLGLDDPPDLDLTAQGEALLTEEGLDGVHREFMAQMKKLMHQWNTLVPTEVRPLALRVQAGNASFEEHEDYLRWVREHSPKITPNFLNQGVTFSPGESGSQRPGNDHLRKHVHKLRPLVRAGVSDQEILDALGRKEAFAEQSLGHFLPLVNLPGFFSNLSYSYLADFGPSELSREDIVLVDHFQFTKNR